MRDMSVRSTRTAEAYARLRSDIIEGRIRPNVHLVAADLAESMSASRTPVREALQLLEVDGLVRPGKRGYLVREHTADEVRQIYEVRAALEGMAARLAAERATDEEIADIEKIGAHTPTAVDDARTSIVMLNGAFHAAIMDAAGNERMKRVNSSNSEHSFNYRIAELYSDGEAVAAVEGHARILDAIQRRDPDAAEFEAKQHVFEALETTLRKMR